MMLIIMTINCSLLRENPKASSQTIEDNFDGNLCRCTGMSHISYCTNLKFLLGIEIFIITGYRPILDAMKSFAVERDNGGLNVDIEVRDCIIIMYYYYYSSYQLSLSMFHAKYQYS